MAQPKIGTRAKTVDHFWQLRYRVVWIIPTSQVSAERCQPYRRPLFRQNSSPFCRWCQFWNHAKNTTARTKENDPWKIVGWERGERNTSCVCVGRFFCVSRFREAYRKTIFGLFLLRQCDFVSVCVCV